MTFYMKHGTMYQVTTREATEMSELLPAGTYAVEQNPITGEFYLDRIRNLEVGDKVYGDAPRLTDRILNTFLNRPDSTGVLLTGEKGSGKTLQAKLLSVTARERMQIPTLTVNRPYRGDRFNQFMQMIDQPVVVIFDEFEKVYSREEQEGMLTLLDGIYPSKKLFVLTCNDKYRINEQMKNRPGRLFYRVEYSGIEEDFIREYANDNLENSTEERIDGIILVAAVFGSFNFDMLKALIEEMNRYGEDAKSASKYLNARPDDDDLDMTYEVELTINGEVIPEEKMRDKKWQGNPILSDLYMNIRYVLPENAPTPVDDGDDDGDILAHLLTEQKRGQNQAALFMDGDLKNVYVDKDGPVFIFENDKHEMARLRRKRTAPVYASVF